jgi:hypothetical protein
VKYRYGKFLTRETYMLLNISENDDGRCCLFSGFERKVCIYKFVLFFCSKQVVISYWLGSETTMDKSGG